MGVVIPAQVPGVLERVTLFSGRSSRAVWHLDPQCPSLPARRTNHAGAFAQLAEYLAGAGIRRMPCTRCGLPALLAAVLQEGQAPGRWHMARVLACPQHRPARCRSCTLLAALADRFDLPRHTDPDGRLVVAAVVTDLYAWALEHALWMPAVHPTPAAVGADALALAWAVRSDAAPPTRSGGVWRSWIRCDLGIAVRVMPAVAGEVATAALPS